MRRHDRKRCELRDQKSAGMQVIRRPKARVERVRRPMLFSRFGAPIEGSSDGVVGRLRLDCRHRGRTEQQKSRQDKSKWSDHRHGTNRSIFACQRAGLTRQPRRISFYPPTHRLLRTHIPFAPGPTHRFLCNRLPRTCSHPPPFRRISFTPRLLRNRFSEPGSHPPSPVAPRRVLP
jgi:hypothetical protein